MYVFREKKRERDRERELYLCPNFIILKFLYVGLRGWSCQHDLIWYFEINPFLILDLVFELFGLINQWFYSEISSKWFNLKWDFKNLVNQVILAASITHQQHHCCEMIDSQKYIWISSEPGEFLIIYSCQN